MTGSGPPPPPITVLLLLRVLFLAGAIAVGLFRRTPAGRGDAANGRIRSPTNRNRAAELRTLYGTDRPDHDTSLEYLRYPTDNGASYYYRTEPDRSYQDTILAVQRHAEKAGLSIRNRLMDSWWYHKGPEGGVSNRTARPNVFPDGTAHLWEKTRWDTVAHTRWWPSETVYARQNGGDRSFVIDEEEDGDGGGGGTALPLEEGFWDDLFAAGKRWGLSVYEQDWMWCTSGTGCFRRRRG